MPKISSFDELDVLISNIARIQDNIRFADTKAAGLVIVNSGFLGFLFGRYTLLEIGKFAGLELFAMLVIWLGVLLMGVATFLLLLGVIFPRGGIKRERPVGLFDNAGVIGFDNATLFVDAFKSASVQEIADDALALIYYLTIIDRKKFDWLKKVIYISIVAWLLGVLGLILFEYSAG